MTTLIVKSDRKRCVGNEQIFKYGMDRCRFIINTRK